MTGSRTRYAGLSKEHYFRIAFNLITSRYQKARRNTLKKHISARALPQMDYAGLSLLGFPKEAIDRIKNHYLRDAEEEVAKANENNIHIIFKEDQLYPNRLAEIYDPPDYIYAKGNTEALKNECLAVVGSRRAGSYAETALKTILPDICNAGLAIVSGMAYGVDSMAHGIAVKKNCFTIGVNAGGLLHLYPAGNKGLIQRITQCGCVISEFSLDTVPRPFYFPIRNRIIAGISRSILVVEAAMKSGSLITARLGLEQNRDIFAVPGRIDSPLSQGTNYLIQQGAKAITSAADILMEYGIVQLKPEKEEQLQLSKKEKSVLELMVDGDVKSIDFLVDQLDEPASAVISTLMSLILKNAVREEPGGYRRHAAGPY